VLHQKLHFSRFFALSKKCKNLPFFLRARQARFFPLDFSHLFCNTTLHSADAHSISLTHSSISLDVHKLQRKMHIFSKKNLILFYFFMLFFWVVFFHHSNCCIASFHLQYINKKKVYEKLQREKANTSTVLFFFNCHPQNVIQLCISKTIPLMF
jgi:hypothetical protein